VYYKAEVEEFARTFFAPKKNQTPADHAKINACIDPAVERFRKLPEEEKEEFRTTLVAYRNLYAFLAQVIPFYDSDLEKTYTYIRYLLTKLPKREGGPKYDFDEDVALKYYRLQKISEGAIVLQKGKGGEVPGPVAVGTGDPSDKKIGLSELIEILNDRFGTDFKPGDQLFLDSIKEDALGNSTLREQAMANTEENFGYAFLKALDGLFVNRMGQNEDITVKFLNEPEFNEAVGKYLLKQVYEQIRTEGKNPASYLFIK